MAPRLNTCKSYAIVASTGNNKVKWKEGEKRCLGIPDGTGVGFKRKQIQWNYLIYYHYNQFVQNSFINKFTSGYENECVCARLSPEKKQTYFPCFILHAMCSVLGGLRATYTGNESVSNIFCSALKKLPQRVLLHVMLFSNQDDFDFFFPHTKSSLPAPTAFWYGVSLYFSPHLNFLSVRKNSLGGLRYCEKNCVNRNKNAPWFIVSERHEDESSL